MKDSILCLSILFKYSSSSYSAMKFPVHYGILALGALSLPSTVISAVLIKPTIMTNAAGIHVRGSLLERLANVTSSQEELNIQDQIYVFCTLDHYTLGQVCGKLLLLPEPGNLVLTVAMY
jgi:hypothetical protein